MRHGHGGNAQNEERMVPNNDFFHWINLEYTRSTVSDEKNSIICRVHSHLGLPRCRNLYLFWQPRYKIPPNWPSVFMHVSSMLWMTCFRTRSLIWTAKASPSCEMSWFVAGRPRFGSWPVVASLRSDLALVGAMWRFGPNWPIHTQCQHADVDRDDGVRPIKLGKT